MLLVDITVNDVREDKPFRTADDFLKFYFHLSKEELSDKLKGGFSIHKIVEYSNGELSPMMLELDLFGNLRLRYSNGGEGN